MVIVQFQVVEQTHGKRGKWRKIELDSLGRLAEGVTTGLDLDGWRKSESFSDSGSPETVTILGTSEVWHVDYSGEGLDFQKQLCECVGKSGVAVFPLTYLCTHSMPFSSF